MENNIQLWTPIHQVPAVTTVEEAYDVQNVPSLTDNQRTQIIAAFNACAYDMASEYAWKKTMVKLKEVIASFGHEFVAQMLNKPSIDEYTPLVSVISDNEAILLAENIGLISEEGALNLRHALEQLSYYFSSKADEEGKTLDKLHAATIVVDCAKHVLSIKSGNYELSFSKFKNQLLNEQLTEGCEMYNQIINCSLFYLRTVCNLLITAIKDKSMAQTECAINNLLLIIAPIWDKLPEEDHFNLGKAYRDVVTDGKEIAAKGLRKVLMKVKGFNYVPESLRSDTFIDAANQLITVHYNFDNFYNEPSAIRALASLGTVIPTPALDICIRAYLLVYMGNYYGVSTDAIGTAREELLKINEDQWQEYLRKSLQHDSKILSNFEKQRQLSNFAEILRAKNLFDIIDVPRDVQQLLKAIKEEDLTRTKQIADAMLRKMR